MTQSFASSGPSRSPTITVYAQCTSSDGCGYYRVTFRPFEALAEARHGKRMLRTHARLDVIETKNGIELTAYDPEFAKQVEIAER